MPNPPPAPELPGRFKVGDTIGGRYRVTQHLGSGAFCDVFKGSHVEIESLFFAIKVLKPRHRDSARIVQQFKAEAETLAQLPAEQSTNAVDLGVLDNGLPFLVMEFVDGRSLAEIIVKFGELPLRIAARYTWQLLKILERCHHMGIVHRDIKPENVRVSLTPGTTATSAALLDFGIATNENTPGANDIVIDYCTPQYSAPEVSEAISLPALDIYSTGVLLSEMISGTLPEQLSSRTPQDLKVENVIGREIEFSREVIMSPLYPLIVKATQPEPEHRFAHAGEMKDALETRLSSAGGDDRWWEPFVAEDIDEHDVLAVFERKIADFVDPARPSASPADATIAPNAGASPDQASIPTYRVPSK